MKREIKFRVWDSYIKTIIYDNIYFYISFNKNGLIMTSPATNNIAMQYTGLKDKNGKEIYEGDIISGLRHLEDDFGLKVVQFKEASFLAVAPQEEADVIKYQLLWRTGDIEIVGNIYEDEHLLTQKPLN